ncbi:hypothetical protein BKA62DRAFT_766868 [Auriculariales sp. MPI-PUGE-AT-0066]|nr:hypothetical protein BKA62DRAFT_766868 [Auriculariales sp. MPI-PUGE-AT-0066]
MCWRVGSVEDVASGCQMCKLYATKGKCTHERQVCSDRTNHPNFDVRHFVNTDCRFANACGYCKMARANPTVDAKYNRGWPGCCRAPSSHEWEMVKDLGIATMISRLHEIPIPTEVKKRLDANPSPKAVPRPQVQQAEREGGEQRTSRLRDNNTVASAPQPNASGAATRPQAPRRTVTAESALPQSQRPSLAARKSASTVQLMQSLSMAPAPRANFTSSLTSSGSSDSGSNRGGAMSDSDASTVRSEFTDYLSEESEAELQRQAQLRIEAKKEEDEFKAARAKLAGIDTTNPPTDWARSGGGHVPTRGGVNVGQYMKSGPQGRPNPPQKGSPPTAAAATSRAPASITEIQRALGGNRPPPAPAVQRQPQQQRA